MPATETVNWLCNDLAQALALLTINPMPADVMEIHPSERLVNEARGLFHRALADPVVKAGMRERLARRAQDRAYRASNTCFTHARPE